jgi:predicted PurR-regulated permease PerM
MQAELSQIAADIANLGLDGEAFAETGNTAVSLLSDIAVNLFGNAVGLILVGLVVLILLIFIISESTHYPARLRRGLGEDNDLLPKIRAFRHSLINYFVARFKVNAITGLIVFIMLWLVGVDFALLWGILAIFLSFIPYFGLILAAIPGVLLAFAQFGTTTAVLVAIGYLVINQVIEQVVAPKIIADDISLSPALTFFALIFWGFIFEFLGVLLAAPLTVMVVLILQNYPDTRWLALLAIADESKKPDEAVEKGTE